MKVVAFNGSSRKDGNAEIKEDTSLYKLLKRPEVSYSDIIK